MGSRRFDTIGQSGSLRRYGRRLHPLVGVLFLTSVIVTADRNREQGQRNQAGGGYADI